MASQEPSNPAPNELKDEGDGSVGKKMYKKEAAKLEGQCRRLEASAAVSVVSINDAPDPLAANYNDIPLDDLMSKTVLGRKWTDIGTLTIELKDKEVLIRDRAQNIRAVRKKIAFIVVRKRRFTVQYMETVAPDLVNGQTVKYATSLSKESIVDVKGVVSVPNVQIKGSTQ